MSKIKNRNFLQLFKTNSGFTLVEIGVAVVMLSALAIVFYMSLGIDSQLQKARDSKKKNDLFQIRNALDTYYNDNSCYPQSVAFGSEWKENGMVYMQKIPSSSDCEGNNCNEEYVYATNSDSFCPQCYLLISNKENKNASAKDNDCENIASLASCLPEDISLKEKICYYGGIVSCECVSSLTMPSVSPLPTETPIPTLVPTLVPTNTPVPTSTPTPTPVCQYYACTGSPSTCNSYTRLSNCTFNGGRVECYCAPPVCRGNECCSYSCSR